jgi:hypothetical protein
VIVALPVTAETSLRLSVPDDAVDEPAEQLPVIDVSRLPGAAIALRRGFHSAGEGELRALCVTAPSDRWAPGVEELVLERASGLARGALGGEVTRFDLGALDRSGPRFTQRFEGSVLRGGAPWSVRGEHLLGFSGEARTAVLCSVVCVEPGAATKRCDARMESLRAEGAWTSAPPPSLAVRAILFTAERPALGVGMAGALALAIVALVLWRRPRPRW